MTAALAAILALIQQVLPLIGGASSATLVASIIKALQTWLPIIVVEVQTLYPIVKNIITTLQSKSDDLTPEQITTLQQIDAQTDAAFEAATVGLDPDAAPATSS